MRYRNKITKEGIEKFFMERGIKKYIGDKAFYVQLSKIVVPIILQQLLISVAGYIDSLMVNGYSDNAYSGVSAANKLVFILMFVWMAISAVSSIFITQYFGAQNKKKIHESARLGIYASVLVGVISFVVFEFFGNAVVDYFIESEESRMFGYRYMSVIKYTALITPINYIFSTMFRSVKKTVLPTITGAIEIIVNVCLNYCLINGKFGFPMLDAKGAAIATVISKVVNAGILISVALIPKKSEYRGLFSTFKFENHLLKSFFKKGTPLLFNELLWALASVAFVKFYTYENDTWFLAYSYSQNICDLFFIFFSGLGNGTAIIIGMSLGKGDFDAARRDSYRLRGLAVVVGLVMGTLMAVLSPVIANLFQPTDEIRRLIINIQLITAVFTAMYAYNATGFFILRAGGDSLRAFILDQVPSMLFGLPFAIVLGVNAANWGLSLPFVFAVAHTCDIVKLFVSTWFVKQEKWIVNLTVLREDETLIEESK